jgi:hypothetical protein
MLHWAWVLGALVSFVPSSLWARPEIHVLIATEGAWPENLEKALREASNRLVQSDLVSIPVPEKSPDLPEADAWFEKAEAALGQLDLDAAQVAHKEALNAFSQCAKLKRPVSELFLSRALLFYVQGDIASAKKELAATAVLDPKLEPDPIRYPPKLVRLYHEAQQETNKKPTALLEASAPKDASIWVDGVLYSAPLLLPIGLHYLRVEKVGALTFVQKVNLSSSGAKINVTLKDDLFAQDQAIRALAAKDPNAILSWATQQGIRELIIVTPSKDRLLLSRFNIQDQKALGQKSSSLARLADDLLRLIEPVGPLSSPVVEPGLNNPKDERSLWKSPAFWVPVGMGVLGGIVLLSVDLAKEQSGARPSINLGGRQ